MEKEIQSRTVHIPCSFKATQTGNGGYFISLQPSKDVNIPGLPRRWVMTLELTNPNSKKQAEIAQNFLDENLKGLSITFY